MGIFIATACKTRHVLPKDKDLKLESNAFEKLWLFPNPRWRWDTNGASQSPEIQRLLAINNQNYCLQSGLNDIHSFVIMCFFCRKKCFHHLIIKKQKHSEHPTQSLTPKPMLWSLSTRNPNKKMSPKYRSW